MSFWLWFIVKSLAYDVLESTRNQARRKVDLSDYRYYDRNKNLFVDQHSNTHLRHTVLLGKFLLRTPTRDNPQSLKYLIKLGFTIHRSSDKLGPKVSIDFGQVTN